MASPHAVYQWGKYKFAISAWETKNPVRCVDSHWASDWKNFDNFYMDMIDHKRSTYLSLYDESYEELYKIFHESKTVGIWLESIIKWFKDNYPEFNVNNAPYNSGRR